MIILKVTKNQGFTLSQDDSFLEKLHGDNRSDPSPSPPPPTPPVLYGLTLRQTTKNTKLSKEVLKYINQVDLLFLG